MISAKLFLAAAAVLVVIVVHAQDIILIDNVGGAETVYDFGTCIAIPVTSEGLIKFNEQADCNVFRDDQCGYKLVFESIIPGISFLEDTFPSISDSGGSILCYAD